MGRAWRALTGRGRTLLIVGLVLTVLSALAGERDIMVVGLLLLLIPVVAGVLLVRSRLRLSCERSVRPNEVAVGEAMTGQLVVSHRSRLPVGVVLLEDDVPVQLGQRPRFLIDEPTQDWHATVSYPMYGQYRGRFHTGPLRVRLTDPFGLVNLDRAFTATSELLVTPRVHPLERLTSLGGTGQTGDNRPQRLGVVGQDDVLVREYRHGDDVRRIHWRSTARRGEMMVRREEQAWDPTCAILLDNRSGAHIGDAVHGSFEWAVSMAASAGSAMITEGFSIELYHGQGRLDLAHVSAQRDAVRHVMLRGLAELSSRAQPSLGHGVEEMQSETAGQLVIAVLGRLTVAEAAAIARARRNRAEGVAVLLDVDSWGQGRRAATDPADGPARTARETSAPADDLSAVEEVLTAQQWRVVRAAAGETVPQVWARVGALQGVRA